MQLTKRPKTWAFKPKARRAKKKRRDGRVRSQKHLTFVREHACLVDGCSYDTIEAHHVGDTATAAMGAKPGDEWAVPLCNHHHNEGHLRGWQTIATDYQLDLREAAMWFAKRSPDQAIREAVKDAD